MNVSSSQPGVSEAQRLENLWSGAFGDAYAKRNRNAGLRRAQFWTEFLSQFPVQSVLEIGCNLGGNLRWLAASLQPNNIYGVDVNRHALQQLRETLPDIRAILAQARALPFGDGRFELVFTMGVLIHQPEVTLPVVMAEAVRCSGRFILCGEYFADSTTEIAYRGQPGALFKRNYGALYQQMFPTLQLRAKGFLGREQGWDDVTYWVFEKA